MPTQSTDASTGAARAACTVMRAPNEYLARRAVVAPKPVEPRHDGLNGPIEMTFCSGDEHVSLIEVGGHIAIEKIDSKPHESHLSSVTAESRMWPFVCSNDRPRHGSLGRSLDTTITSSFQRNPDSARRLRPGIGPRPDWVLGLAVPRAALRADQIAATSGTGMRFESLKISGFR